MADRADEYRDLARECEKIALTVPPGDVRTALLEMAQEWERLADQQEHASDLLQQKRRLADRRQDLALKRVHACGGLIDLSREGDRAL